MSIKFDSPEAIEQSYQQIYRGIDIGQDDILAQISGMVGDSDFTDPEDEFGVNGDTRQPINGAIEVMHLAKSPMFQQLYSGIKEKVSGWVSKSKSESVSADVRALNHNKTIGGEEILAYIGSFLSEAQEAVASMTTQEAQLVGITDRKQFAKTLSEEADKAARPVTYDAQGNNTRQKRAFRQALDSPETLLAGPEPREDTSHLQSTLNKLNRGIVPQQS